MPSNPQIIDLAPIPAAGTAGVLPNGAGVLWEVVGVMVELQTAVGGGNRSMRLVFDDGNNANTFLSIPAPISHPADTSIYYYYGRDCAGITGSAAEQRVLVPLPLVYLGPSYRVRVAGVPAGDSITRFALVVVEPCPCWRPWWWWWWWPWRWPLWKSLRWREYRG